ncbi:MAG: phosphopantetheinyl transferase [Planctomycetota bacterium]|jgi:phosphopantetheinyl transferase
MSALLMPVMLQPGLQDKRTPPPERIAAQRTASKRAVRASATRNAASIGVLRKAGSGAPLQTQGWHYSLSHCSSWVAGVIHRAPVGIDVEAVQERRQELVEKALSDEERSLMPEQDAALAFARAWTAKESILKRAGIGLGDLSKCKIIEQQAADELVLEYKGERQLVRQLVHEGHVFALHTAGIDWSVSWDGFASIEAGA